MKINRNIFSNDAGDRKYKAFAEMTKWVYCLCVAPVMEAFFSSVSSREKLQIIYANIRV